MPPPYDMRQDADVPIPTPLEEELDQLTHPRPIQTDTVKPDQVRVVDATTGEESYLPADEATEAFKAGAVNLPKDSHVGVADAEGELHETDPNDANAVVAAGGSLVPRLDAHRADLAREYGGFKGGAIATAAGAGDALTMGLSDAAIRGIGGDDAAEAVQASNLAHPYLHTAGQIGGFALGSALLPGAGLGGLAEEGAHAGLSALSGGALATDAAGLGSRLLARGAGLAARGAVEGPQFALQDMVSEAALHQHFDATPELTGQQIMMNLGHAGVMGAVYGALAGAGTEALTTGVREGLSSERLTRLANNEMWRDINSGKGITKKIMGRVEGGTDAIGQTARDIGLDDPRLNLEGQFAKAQEAKEEAGQALSDLYKNSSATGSVKPLLEKLDALTEDVKKVAGAENVVNGLEKYRASLVEKLTTHAGEPAEEAAEEAAAAQPEAPTLDPKDAALRAEVERLKAAGSRKKADELENLRAGIFGPREAPAPARAPATEPAAAPKIPAVVLDTPVPIGELWEQRKGLDALLKWESAADPDRRVAILRAFRGQFQDYIAEIGEQAAKEGQEFAAPLKQLNQRYSHLSYINDALEEKVARQLTNRRFSLTDSIMQAGGGAGGMAAIVAGHPLMGLAAMAGGAANKFLRERGPQVAAFVLGHAGGLDGIAQHMQQLDSAVSRTADAVMARGESSSAHALPAAARSERESQDDYEAHAGMIREMADHPQLASAIDEHFEGVARDAPQSAKAAAASTKRAVAYLAMHLPPPMRLDPLRPEVTTPPSLGEQTKWLRRLDALDHRDALLGQIASLRVDPLALDAVRTVTPDYFAKVQHAIRDRISSDPAALPRSARLALSPVLSMPMTPSARAETVMGRQKTFAEQGAPAPQGEGGGTRGPKGSASRVKISEAFPLATASDQIAMKGH